MQAAESPPSKPAHQVPRLLLLGFTWGVLGINMFFTALAQVDATSLKTGKLRCHSVGAFREGRRSL